MQLITINEAATMASKSVQTIRRMIKQKKVSVQKQKTPQGFNYMIVKESLVKFMNTSPGLLEESETVTDTSSTEKPTEHNERMHRPISQDFENIFRGEIGKFTSTIQKLVEQNERDKENFFNLIKTFQDRVVTLEDQIKAIEAPKKGWWKLW